VYKRQVLRSANCPLIFPATALRAKPGPMLAATSAKVQGEGRVRVEPSGNETLTCELKRQSSGQADVKIERQLFMTVLGAAQHAQYERAMTLKQTLFSQNVRLSEPTDLGNFRGLRNPSGHLEM
jgi:hypothetical protein